jgi:AcrR family transcriptional regulator
MLSAMPREVDADQRLADIADATVRVARATGAQSVTIRSVAGELGGSTTLVTNYLPTRAALITNALDRAQDRWRVERDDAGATADAADRLSALLEATLRSTSDDPVLRTLILEIVANASVEPDLRAKLRHESTVFQDELAEAAADSGYSDSRRVAEVTYLLLRGATIATAEDPALWNDEHLREVILETAAALHHPASRR